MDDTVMIMTMISLVLPAMALWIRGCGFVPLGMEFWKLWGTREGNPNMMWNTQD